MMFRKFVEKTLAGYINSVIMLMMSGDQGHETRYHAHTEAQRKPRDPVAMQRQCRSGNDGEKQDHLPADERACAQLNHI